MMAAASFFVYILGVLAFGTVVPPALVGSTKIKLGTALIYPIGSEPPNWKDKHNSTNNDFGSSTSEGSERNPSPVAGGDGPDGQAVQRAFLVLAGLGVIVISYFGLKFLCAKKRRRRNPTSSYGQVETSEMELLDNEEEEDDADEDDTLFDLHSHRRT